MSGQETKRQIWRCLLKMIWCTPVARVATALALSMQTLKIAYDNRHHWGQRNLKKPEETRCHVEPQSEVFGTRPFGHLRCIPQPAKKNGWVVGFPELKHGDSPVRRVSLRVTLASSSSQKMETPSEMRKLHKNLCKTPLKNMSSSVGMIIPNIWKINPNVPNHQPAYIVIYQHYIIPIIGVVLGYTTVWLFPIILAFIISP